MRCVVFFSGIGSTCEALLKYQSRGQYQIDLLITDNPFATGIALANDYSTELLILPRRLDNGTKLDSQQWCQILHKRLANYDFDLIVLAGFMSLLSKNFVDLFADRIINIHPSLLPELKGLHTHQRALAQGKSEHGFSVHLVTEELDSGPILAQYQCRIESNDSAESLQHRVQQAERYWYPRVIDMIASKQLSWKGEHVYFYDKMLSDTGLVL